MNRTKVAISILLASFIFWMFCAQMQISILNSRINDLSRRVEDLAGTMQGLEREIK